MAKKRKTAPQEAGAQQTEPQAVVSAATKRIMVLVSEADREAIRAAFAAGTATTVTVLPPTARPLSDEQREKRKAYRQRPEVREKQKAYRAARAKRLRAAMQALTATASVAEQGV